MTEPMETPRAKKRRWIGPIIMAAGAATMLLAFGLCAASGALPTSSGPGELSGIGVVLFVLALLALLVGGVMFVVELIVSASRGK
jgi:hypothetical protein